MANVINIPLTGTSDGDPTKHPSPYLGFEPALQDVFCRKLGVLWAQDHRQYQEGSQHMLEQLPHGYAVFKRLRQQGQSARHHWDYYLFGSPDGSKIDRASKFYPHLKRLMAQPSPADPAPPCPAPTHPPTARPTIGLLRPARSARSARPARPTSTRYATTARPVSCSTPTNLPAIHPNTSIRWTTNRCVTRRTTTPLNPLQPRLDSSGLLSEAGYDRVRRDVLAALMQGRAAAHPAQPAKVGADTILDGTSPAQINTIDEVDFSERDAMEA